MSNSNFGANAFKLGVAAALGYGAYKGGKHLINKANEYAQTQEELKMLEQQQRVAAQQHILQQQQLEQVAQHCQHQYNLVRSLLSDDDFGGALHASHKVISLLNQLGEPNGELRTIYAEVYTLMGQAQLNLEDYSGAISSLDSSLVYDSDNAEGYALRAIAKMQNNDSGGAKTDIAIAISLAPEDSRYRSIQNEITRIESHNTDRGEKNEIVRIHEKTIAAVANQIQEKGVDIVSAFNNIVEEHLVLPLALVSQLYVISDLEMQLLSSIPQMEGELPKAFVDYWKFKQQQETLAVFNEIGGLFVQNYPQLESEAITSAVSQMHQQESQVLALPGLESQLANFEWIQRNAHKQAATVAFSVTNNELHTEKIMTSVVNFSKSMSHAFFDV